MTLDAGLGAMGRMEVQPGSSHCQPLGPINHNPHTYPHRLMKRLWGQLDTRIKKQKHLPLEQRRTNLASPHVHEGSCDNVRSIAVLRCIDQAMASKQTNPEWSGCPTECATVSVAMQCLWQCCGCGVSYDVILRVCIHRNDTNAISVREIEI